MDHMRSTEKFPAGSSSTVGVVSYSSPGIRYDGAPIGVLINDATAGKVSPRPPGTPGTADTFDVPLLCRVVEGCTVERLIFDGDDALAEPMVAAARTLVDEGARAITSNCGFMIRHQAAVSNAVDVPVLLSGLLLAPLLLTCMSGNRKLGIITASAASLTDDLLTRAGIGDLGRVVVGGLEGRPAFRTAILERAGGFDSTAIETETVTVAGELVAKHPDVAALLFECTVLPPYAAAVQRVVGLPVFDPVGLIDLFLGGFAPDSTQRFLLGGTDVGYLAPSWLNQPIGGL